MSGQVASRLCSQTTILFRLGVLAAIVILGALAYQQTRVSALLQERVATSAGRLDQFSAALARARREALTPGDLQGLRSELAGRLETAAQRLEILERRSSAAERVITAASPAILFLQGAYGFRHKESGRMLRQVVDADGHPLISPLGQPMLTLDGDGPVAERQFTGSAFVVGDPPRIVTNRHVAKPWESDTAGAEMLAAQGLDAVLIKFIAYAPGEPTPRPVAVTRVSEEADLAVLRFPGIAPAGPALRLRASPPKPGDEVFVLGYPTGLRTMLVQAGDAFIAALQKEKDTNFWSVAARLAKSGYIAPLASRGIVGQVTKAAIVYDAETTQGGSGGPVLNANGEVIAVNAAILPEFGGSNLGVPAARVEALLRAGPGQ
jgi:S1-C subfamily serine protease